MNKIGELPESEKEVVWRRIQNKLKGKITIQAEELSRTLSKEQTKQ